jgi:hypothetical protein
VFFIAFIVIALIDIIIAWISIVVVGRFNCFAPHTSGKIIGVFLDRIHNNEFESGLVMLLKPFII